MTKICSKCKLSKTLTDFHKSSRYGHQHRCKECARTFTQRATQLWRINNPEAVRMSNKRTKTTTKYGISLEQIREMLILQGGSCAICKKALSFTAYDKRDKPHVDHNHDTGTVRGLLCLTCNTGIGMFGDSINLLDAAKSYLVSAVQAERLSELAPLTEEDAIVRSHEKMNHEKLAEMPSSAFSE